MLVNKQDTELIINLKDIAVGLSIVIANYGKVNGQFHEGACSALRNVMSEINSYFKK